MDRSQQFIKKCLFTKNFDDPNKPIAEKRLQETLLLLPTDGGLSTRLKKNRKKLRINANTLENVVVNSKKHDDYKRINKNSKIALKDYINRCKANVHKTLRIAHDQQLYDKGALGVYLKEKEPHLWELLPHYDKFLPMHRDLWCGYIREVLNIPPKVTDPSTLTINGSSALMKLSMADYNGAFLKVAKSTNKNMIGTEGIVIWDSQKNFIMITKGKLLDELKIIPKKGTVFNMEVPINEDHALLYTILGDRFKYRSSDRAGRKFKNRRCDDMLYYISNTN